MTVLQDNAVLQPRRHAPRRRMENQTHRTPPPAATAPALPVTADRAHWTPAKQRIFLAALLESGSVARAAKAAGMSASSAHRLRRRLAGSPFDRAWGHVLGRHARRLADPLAPDAPPPPAIGQRR